MVRNCGLTWINQEYKGILVKIDYPKISLVSNRALNMWRRTLPVNGGSLFNMLPRTIRDISNVSVDTFKSCLDTYLEGIPDCPRTNTLSPDPINPITLRNSNCLMDWIRYIGRNKDKYKGDNQFFVSSH